MSEIENTVEATETPAVEVETEETEAETPTLEAVETTETEAKEETTTTGDDSPESEAEQRRKSVQPRINELTARAKAAEERAKLAEETAEARQKQLDELTSNVPAFPQLEDFDYDQGKYQQAIAEHNALVNRSTVHQALTEQQQQQAEAARREVAEAQIAAFQARDGAFAAEHTDYRQTVQNPAFLQGEAMTKAILKSDNGPALAYHLAKNPATTAEINAMDHDMALMTLGRLSSRLASPRPVTTTSTPSPVSPVKPSGKTEKSWDDMTPDEYRKARGYKE